MTRESRWPKRVDIVDMIARGWTREQIYDGRYYTYAVEFLDERLIKVGRTRNMDKRLRALERRAFKPFRERRVRVLLVIIGDRELRVLKLMHRFLFRGREWFRATRASKQAVQLAMRSVA